MCRRTCVLRFAGGFAGAVLLLLLSPIGALAQYYLPGPEPTRGDIDHWTQAVWPQDRSRTEIGIGEPVDLDVSTYDDMDIYVDDLGMEYPQGDMLGLAEWTVDGPGQVWPTRGAQTTYTAPMCDWDSGVAVHVELNDTGAMGLDPAIMKSLSFTIRVPKGISVAFDRDNWIGNFGPPINSMGATSSFYCFILPNTVNFWNVAFREEIAEQTFDWPDGTRWVREGATVPYEVSDLVDGVHDGPNYVRDMVSTGLHNPAHLLLANSNPPTYVDCQFNVLVPDQFASVNGWITFEVTTDPFKFRARDFQSQVGSGGDWGGWQGPYTDPPVYP